MGQDLSYQQAIAWTPVLTLAALISQPVIDIIQRRKEYVLLYLVHLFILMISSEPLPVPYASLKLPETAPTFTAIFFLHMFRTQLSSDLVSVI